MVNLREFQKAQLSILKTVNEILTKHDICPFLVGGSCLGAVRHGGVIPWDDDIDIGLFRSDYEKARIILQKELPEKFILCDRHTEKEYPLNFYRIRMNGTAYVQDYSTRLNIHQGIFMDVFPFDARPDDDKLFKKQYKKSQFLKKCLSLKNMSFKKMGKIRPVKQLIPIFIGHIFVNRTRAQNKLDKVITQYNDSCENSKYLLNFLSIYDENDHVERKWLTNLKECDFDGVPSYITSFHDDYLSLLYGDYMTPPPKDKRTPHHGIVFASLTEEYQKK